VNAVHDHSGCAPAAVRSRVGRHPDPLFFGLLARTWFRRWSSPRCASRPLRRHGWRVDHKRAYPPNRAEGLAVRGRRRKRMTLGLDRAVVTQSA